MKLYEFIYGTKNQNVKLPIAKLGEITKKRENPPGMNLHQCNFGYILVLLRHVTFFCDVIIERVI